MAKTIVLYPSPGMGHLISMVELGKLILKHRPSYSIIVLTLTTSFNTGTTAAYVRRISATFPAITFHHLPDIPLNPDQYLSMEAIIFDVMRRSTENVDRALRSIPEITVFIIDVFCTPAMPVADNLNIPVYYYITTCASCLGHILYFPTFHKTLPGSFKDMDTLISSPGLPPVHPSVLPGPVLDRNSSVYSDFLLFSEHLPKSAGMIVNTFDSLEPRVIKAITDGLCVPDQPTPPLYTIGPLVADGGGGDGDGSHECLTWLDSQPSQSVVYLCFGSLGLFSSDQLKEIATGLEKSGHRFLWVVRSPPSENKGDRFLPPPEPDLDSLLPEGFLDRTRDRGMVVKRWAPQVAVLNKEAVGAFVTHCGWNSVLEAVSAGVPMVAWPLYAEQRFNKVVMVEEMKVALPMEEFERGKVSAEEVEKRVRQVMEDKGLREVAKARKEEAAMAISDGGSSSVALNKFLESCGQSNTHTNPLEEVSEVEEIAIKVAPEQVVRATYVFLAKNSRIRRLFKHSGQNLAGVALAGVAPGHRNYFYNVRTHLGRATSPAYPDSISVGFPGLRGKPRDLSSFRVSSRAFSGDFEGVVRHEIDDGSFDVGFLGDGFEGVFEDGSVLVDELVNEVEDMRGRVWWVVEGWEVVEGDGRGAFRDGFDVIGGGGCFVMRRHKEDGDVQCPQNTKERKEKIFSARFFSPAQLHRFVYSRSLNRRIVVIFGQQLHDTSIYILNGGDRFSRSGRQPFAVRNSAAILVCGYIRQWVDDNVLNHISGETHARTLWNKLEQLYARKTGNNKLFLIKKLIQLKYHDGTPITDRLNTFQGIINQLSGMGIKFEDEIQGLWILGTLPDSWETFRTSLSNSAPDGVISMELAKGSILNEEMGRKSQGSSSQSDVLVTESRGRSHSRGPSNRGKNRSKSKGKFGDFECYHCGRKGHTTRFCRQLKRENKKANYNNQKNNQKKDDGGNDGAEVNTTTEEFFICWDDEMVNLAHDDSSWVVDTGATCHVLSQRDFYSSYTPGNFGNVKMGNHGLSKIVGVGDVCLKFDTGMELVLQNVKHVPDMRLNVLSAGLLDDEGYNNFGNGRWKLTRGSLIVARGKKSPKLYMTYPKISNNVVNAVENTDMIDLWHKRLGHMSEKGMSLLSKRNVLSGVHDVRLKKCSHCLAGKQNRVSFKSHPPSRKDNILDLVHSDVCGPMKTRTLGGCSYFVTFIDDHSRKVWVYTLKSKDQVFDVFKQFHASVERQTGKKLKYIRTDNGGEYIGRFDAYCREHGIRHQKSPPKTPQLNGLAERMNRTLVERVRCLLSHAELPKSFWGEALNTAVHVINLTPCVPLSFDVSGSISQQETNTQKIN
ncbi:hypothetical protein OSB04_025578 [Centaurea solstitialis]|uniref:UDP-glycosyltransferases domain-containing protein n=1 Tax=Centaurea solstitialis TaxID=347529 RepID=A0AA38WEX2_9ASTR|nr:hypothetical protein OSB04_025578 [Centaurea solstitialis]